MDFPRYSLPPPPILLPDSLESDWFGTQASAATNQTNSSNSSFAWPVNNKAYFYPFRLLTFATVYQLLFFVGATSAGNIDVGIYDSQKRRIVSAGTTAMSATVNTVQELNVTDTVLPPGDYLLAAACSTTGGFVFGRSALNDELTLGAVPVYEQTSALPLPDPCVPVLCTDASVPMSMSIGIQLVPTF